MGRGCQLEHECYYDRWMKAIFDQEQLKLQPEKRGTACPGYLVDPRNSERLSGSSKYYHGNRVIDNAFHYSVDQALDSLNGRKGE